MPGYSTTVRNNRLTQVLNAMDAQTAHAIANFYNAPRPATGGAITTQTLLCQLTMNKPSGTVNAGVLTMSVSPAVQEGGANNSGTPAWGRVTDGAGNFVMDISAGIGSGEANFGAAVVAGQPVTLNSWTLTDGNP